MLQGASTEVKDILDRTLDSLTAEYKEMFRPSLKCKPPHLHEAIFRDDLFQSGIVERQNIKSHSDLEALIATTNSIYSKRSMEEWENILIGGRTFKSKGKLLIDAVNKARMYKFFLGLDNSWMHQEQSTDEKK